MEVWKREHSTQNILDYTAPGQRNDKPHRFNKMYCTYRLSRSIGIHLIRRQYLPKYTTTHRVRSADHSQPR